MRVPQWRSSQNVESDLHRWVKGLCDLTMRPFRLPLPLWDTDDTRPIEVPVLLPHAWLAAVWHAGPAQWARSLVGDDGEAASSEFWEWYVMQPFGAEHPAFADPHNLARHIPMVVHCDGGEAYTNFELTVWSISSLLVHGGDTWDTKFILATIPTWRMPTKAIRDVAASVARPLAVH